MSRSAPNFNSFKTDFMLKHPTLTQDRITGALPAIHALIYPAKHPVRVEAWHVGGEPVSPEKALEADYTPFAVGGLWGPAWDTTWFRVRGEVPVAWAGREVVVLFRVTDQGREGFTAEGLIYCGPTPVRALNANRNEVEIATVALGGEQFEFHVEAAANVSDPAGINIKHGSGPLFTLAQAELACIDRAAFAYYYDYKVAAEAMMALPETSQRRGELMAALNQSLNRLDFSDASTIAPAREALAAVLAKKNGDTAHQLSAIGHAHIDTAWLWPLRETIRKCARTFSTAVDYMDRYPEYIFGCSQAQQYAWMKAYYPTIYAKMRERIARGQWEPIGSMWVEVDCNLASGESLIRQIVHGKRFFQEEFGYETRDAWIPDVFGYSAALPQIFQKCDIDSFVTQKISWNQFNKFPHHTFLWEGIDGTQIFTHFPPADTYNGEMDAQSLVFNVTNFKEHGRASRSIYVYGFGDGGGGPSIDMLEQARRLSNFDGLPKVQPEKAIDFLAKAQADATDLPVWVGELYLELHRGTYTTQAKTKRGNRKSEFLLRDAEFFDAVSRILAPERSEHATDPERAIYDVTGLGAPDAHRHSRALERAWRLVLLNQFHDIIPGSSIGWVYRDAEHDYETIADLGGSVLRSSLAAFDGLIDTSRFTAPVRLANTLNFAREEVIALPNGTLAKVRVPACGYTVLEGGSAKTATAGSGVTPVTVEQVDGGIILQNAFIRLHLNAEGLITSLRDLEANREVIAPGAEGNLFQLHTDKPNKWDAWDIDLFYKETCTDLRAAESVEIVEAQPLRATVRIVRRFGASTIRQDVILTADSHRLDFATEVDWHEDHKLLKVAFPVDIRSPRATYEIQFGHVERPTHYNTSWDLARFEVCAQKWADLSEGDYGVALLNDCKYGYDIHGNVLRLSLLRAPTSPDPTADRGTHRFTYSLLPHTGDIRSGRVVEEAYQLNIPVLAEPLPVRPGSLAPELSLFETDRPGVIIESIKLAEDSSGVVVRLYEAYGTRGPVTLRTALPLPSVSLTNMLEQEIGALTQKDGAVSLELHPFEIVTLKFHFE